MSVSAYKQTAQTAANPIELEFRAFCDVTHRLTQADKDELPMSKRAEALFDNIALWSILLSDLADGNNPYPNALKAQLISLGLWSQKQSRAALRREAPIKPLIEVNRNIAEGLAQSLRNTSAAAQTAMQPGLPGVMQEGA